MTVEDGIKLHGLQFYLSAPTKSAQDKGGSQMVV